MSAKKRNPDPIAGVNSPAPKRTKEEHNASEELISSGQAVLASLRDFLNAGPSEDDCAVLKPPKVAAVVKYADYLETVVAETQPKELSDKELKKQTAVLRSVVYKGISGLMKWRPSCKFGSAAYSFSGACSDPKVMAKLLHVDDATKFKSKKFSSTQFQDEIMFAEVTGSARYCSLHLTSDVNLRWNHETGEYKFTGKYGKWGTGKNAVKQQQGQQQKKAAEASKASEADEDDNEQEDEGNEEEEEEEDEWLI